MAKKIPGQSLIYLEIERSKLSREKGRLALITGLLLYVGLTLAGVVGFAFDYISLTMLYVFIFLAIIVLALGTIPYILIIRREDTVINHYLGKLRGGR